MVRRVLLAFGLGIVLSSCAAAPALFGQSNGHVAGHVSVRACGGAYREDQPPCRATPVSGAQITFRLNGATQETTATTDSSGAYAVDLKPGTYAVQLHVPGSPPTSPVVPTRPSRLRFTGPSNITVNAGETVTADFSESIQLL